MNIENARENLKSVRECVEFMEASTRARRRANVRFSRCPQNVRFCDTLRE
jgi:hypothetical protein